MIRGSVTVETLPADVSIPQVFEKATREGRGKDRERGAQDRYRDRINRTLTIWLSLRGNSGGGDDCRRDHSLKQGQSRRRIAASHGIINWGGTRQRRASEVVPIDAGEGNQEAN
jgi:hypothetical protein